MLSDRLTDERHWKDSQPRDRHGRRCSHGKMWEEGTLTGCGRARWHYPTSRWIYACDPARPNLNPGRKVIVPKRLRRVLDIDPCAFATPWSACNCCGFTGKTPPRREKWRA